MVAFIARLPGTGTGPRLAIKDLIDVAGLPTSAGCLAVAEQAEPAAVDAPLLAGARAAEARGELRIVGKTHLHELAIGPTGINPAFGTPTNPLDPALIPGGSSSGSAVAVGSDEADIALGSDSGGSVRIPSACCGTTGLKTTFGRIDTTGVWPLAPSFDTIGPMGRDIAAVTAGMRLLEPGFEPGFPSARARPLTVGRFRPTDVDPVIDQAVDRALAAAGFEVIEVDFAGWSEVWLTAATILVAEAWLVDGHLLTRPDLVGESTAELLRYGGTITPDSLAGLRQVAASWGRRLSDVVDRVGVLALPTLPILTPTPADARVEQLSALTLPVNLAGLPALAMPIPCDGRGRGSGFGPGRLPASLQLVGSARSEATLLAMGAVVEEATA